MFQMFHVCLQAGSSLHGPTQTADTPLPPSPVYKDSCEQFSWPLLEPQVLVICISSHMNVNAPVSCDLHQCCLHHVSQMHSDGMTSNQTLLLKVLTEVHLSIIPIHETCNCHEMTLAKVCLWLAKQVPCMVHAIMQRHSPGRCWTLAVLENQGDELCSICIKQ